MRKRSVRKSVKSKRNDRLKSRSKSRSRRKISSSVGARCIYCNVKVSKSKAIKSAVFPKKSKPKIITFCCTECMEKFNFKLYEKYN